jgi:hypothetical protein
MYGALDLAKLLLRNPIHVEEELHVLRIPRVSFAVLRRLVIKVEIEHKLVWALTGQHEPAARMRAATLEERQMLFVKIAFVPRTLASFASGAGRVFTSIHSAELGEGGT